MLCEDGRFPSPVGELHFSIGCAGVYSDKKRVSVPCRGTTFLNLFPYRVSKSKTGFRPLSGNYISQYIPATVNIDQKSFRPLSGNYISQWKSQILLIMASFVSVPCRGTTFLNMSENTEQTNSIMLFPSPVGELHFSIPSLQSRHQSGLMVGIAWEKYFWKNK